MQKKSPMLAWSMALGFYSLAFSCTSLPALAGEAVLYAFQGGNDGAAPIGPLLDVNGVFYGMTNSGGKNGYGTIFSLTFAGAKTTLYSFQGGSDGVNPVGGLINVKGIFYGNTQLGGGASACGSTGCGVVFSITPFGDEKVLAALPGGSGPAFPGLGGLIDVDGILYGTTYEGGASQTCGDVGCGTVYAATLQGGLKTVYSFQSQGENDGISPVAPLKDIGGTLYGTTYAGGLHLHGTIFSLTTSGRETILYSFLHLASRPERPSTSLAYLNGTFYGTTSQGSNNAGTAFLLRPTGAFRELHGFGGVGDGILPESLMSSDHMFYGVTAEGGATGNGTLFSLSKTGVETQLYSFTGGSDASYPNSKLIEANGTFYGTSTNGGGSKKCKGGCGTVFMYAP